MVPTPNTNGDSEMTKKQDKIGPTTPTTRQLSVLVSDLVARWFGAGWVPEVGSAEYGEDYHDTVAGRRWTYRFIVYGGPLESRSSPITLTPDELSDYRARVAAIDPEDEVSDD